MSLYHSLESNKKARSRVYYMHLIWPLVIIMDLVERFEELTDNPVVLLSCEQGDGKFII